MFDTDLLMTLDRVATVLDQLGVEWAIGGSIASSVHGEPRSTNDVDIIAKLRRFHARKLVQALGDDFYAVETVVEEAIDENRSFNVIDQRTVIKVDVFVPAPGPMGEGQLERRTKAEFDEDLEYFVLSREDTILQKLRWYELGNRVSDRQWRDIVGLLRIPESQLDREYLESTARAAGLADLLARALEDT